MRRKIITFLTSILMLVAIPYKSLLACNLCIVIWCCCPYPCTSCGCICCQFCMAAESTNPLPYTENKAVKTQEKRNELADERANELEKTVAEYSEYLKKGVMLDNEKITGIPKLDQLKSRIITDGGFLQMVKGFEENLGSEIDLDNPVSIGSSLEQILMTPIVGTIEEVNHQSLMRRQMDQVDIFSNFAKVILMQKEIDDTRGQIDALVSQIDDAADLNTITKTNVVARALLTKVLAQKNEISAFRQRRESFKKILLNTNPVEESVLGGVN